MQIQFGLIFLTLFLLSCNKDKVAPAPIIIEPVYHQSDGNLLLLVVGDSLDYGFEFNLDSIQLSNDSLTLTQTTAPDSIGLYTNHYWKINADFDTLFWYYSNVYTFMEDQINPQDLLSISESVPYNSSQFQLIYTSSNTDVQSIWNKVDHLNIVKEYRNSAPNTKIGIIKLVMQIYLEELGFSVPVEKYFILLTK